MLYIFGSSAIYSSDMRKIVRYDVIASDKLLKKKVFKSSDVFYDCAQLLERTEMLFNFK